MRDQHNDPQAQLEALQSLSDVFILASEEQYQRGAPGYINSLEFTKALINIIKLTNKDEFGVSQSPAVEFGLAPDLIMLSCRCIGNLIETNPNTVSYVVQNGGTQAIISKLMEIEYIDLAEEILTVLLKVSLEYPR